MERQQILDLYDWEPGVCFRHPAKGDVETAVVKTVRPRRGDAEQVRACEDCVVAMEQARWAQAGREGLDYEPGHAGEEFN